MQIVCANQKYCQIAACKPINDYQRKKNGQLKILWSTPCGSGHLDFFTDSKNVWAKHRGGTTFILEMHSQHNVIEEVNL